MVVTWKFVIIDLFKLYLGVIRNFFEACKSAIISLKYDGNDILHRHLEEFKVFTL